MARMINLTENGREITVNADTIKWFQEYASKKGTRIYFIDSSDKVVSETFDSVRLMLK